MEEKRNIIPYVIILLFVITLVLVGGLTNYKVEKLVCDVVQDSCLIEKINLFNVKTKKTLVKYSQITDVTYYAQKVKGNRYGKGYREYFLAFDVNGGDNIKVFSKSYYDKNELNKVIKNLKKEMFSGNKKDKIEYKREN